MISVLQWISKGVAKTEPELYEMSHDDITHLKEKLEEKEEGEENETIIDDYLSNSSESDNEEEEDSDREEERNNMEEEEEESANDLNTMESENDAFMKSLKLEEYDNEDVGAVTFLGGKSVAMYESNAFDPYLAHDKDLGDAESDNEDVNVKANDAILLIGRSDEERNRLEVFIYEEESCNLFVHHDFELPAFPLCFSWIGVDPRLPADENNKASFVAVGTFLPEIEIWNLDVVDILEPALILGGRETVSKKPGKKKREKIVYKAGSHTDSVLTLATHSSSKYNLASGSADCSIKLWDIMHPDVPLHTFEKAHDNKVQTMQFMPTNANFIMSASYDCTARIHDFRANSTSAIFKLDGEAESCCWNPFSENNFCVSTENGLVHSFDARNTKDPIFTISAHKKACSSISFNQTIPDLLLSSSLDGTLKVWDMSNNQSQLLTEKKMHVGALFGGSFYKDSTFLVATGGAQGTVALWDLLEDPIIRRTYGNKYATQAELDIYDKAENVDETPSKLGKVSSKNVRKFKRNDDEDD